MFFWINFIAHQSKRDLPDPYAFNRLINKDALSLFPPIYLILPVLLCCAPARQDFSFWPGVTTCFCYPRNCQLAPILGVRWISTSFSQKTGCPAPYQPGRRQPAMRRSGVQPISRYLIDFYCQSLCTPAWTLLTQSQGEDFICSRSIEVYLFHSFGSAFFQKAEPFITINAISD